MTMCACGLHMASAEAPGTCEVAKLRAERDALSRERDALRTFYDKVKAAEFDGEGKCTYCHGIGACPRCWGRAGITRLEKERDARGAALSREVEGLREALREVQVLDMEPPSTMQEYAEEHLRVMRLVSAALSHTKGTLPAPAAPKETP